MKDPKQNAQYISTKIKSLRDECGWNQSELAKKSGVTASAISMIESGQRVPSLVVIRKISDGLKVSVAELTGESTQEESSQNAQAFFRQFGDINELDEGDQDIILTLAKSLRERNNAKGSS
jgi:transcriptional regulator with XRE-family HTH domain